MIILIMNIMIVILCNDRPRNQNWNCWSSSFFKHVGEASCSSWSTMSSPPSASRFLGAKSMRATRNWTAVPSRRAPIGVWTSTTSPPDSSPCSTAAILVKIHGFQRGEPHGNMERRHFRFFHGDKATTSSFEELRIRKRIHLVMCLACLIWNWRWKLWKLFHALQQPKGLPLQAWELQNNDKPSLSCLISWGTTKDLVILG